MSYITVNVDVDVDYNDLDEEDLIDALEYKLDRYTKKDMKDKKESLKKAIAEMLDNHVEQEDLVFTDLPGSLLEHNTVAVLKQLSKKYTLTQLEELLNR